MALPSAKFYTTGDEEITTTQEFGSVQAGAYTTGKTFRLYNDYNGSLGSVTATSVKLSVRGSSGGIDEIWVQQHWVQIKSDGVGSTGIVDDAQTIYTAVGKNKELSVGDIPSGEYRTIYARCYPPTDAAENPDIDFQLRVTYQQPATSICNWITGLRGNGVVASTGKPFAMSTTGATDPIPYEGGYALIYNNEVYYGSSGTYDITTTGSGTYKIYLNESGAFGETTGDVDDNQLQLYEATISSGVCTALSDKRVYLSGLQSGTTGAMPTTPDLGDLYLDITNGKLYAAKTAGNWTVIVPGATFVALTDTPANYTTGDASKILTVTTGENAVEFTSSTGIALDSFGTPSTGTSLNATTGRHGLLPQLGGGAVDYLRADGTWATPPGATGGEANTASNAGTTGIGIYYQKTGVELQFKAIHSTGNISVTDSTGTHTVNLDVISTGIKLDDLGTPDDNIDLNATTGHHGLLLKLTGSTSTYLNADGAWATPPGATGGATNFLQLTDTPEDYTDDASKILAVTTGEDAVEFITSTGILLDNLGTPEDNTDLNATTGYHGLLPILDGNAAHWLDGSGAWTAPTASEVGALESSGAFTVNRIPQITSTGGVLKASVFAVTTGDVFDFGAHSAGFTEQAINTTTGTAAINWNSGLKALFTRSTGAAGVVTFSFTAPVKSANLMLTIRGSTAGSTGTVTWPAIKWDGGSAPSLGSGASAINVVSFYYSTGLTSYLGASSTGTFSS